MSCNRGWSPLPRNQEELNVLTVYDAAWTYRALGLARALSLVATADTVGLPRTVARLVACSRSAKFVFQLSLSILRTEREAPGSFTRRRNGQVQ